MVRKPREACILYIFRFSLVSVLVAGISKFSTHSATSAANSVISERNLRRHGRWASISAKNTYIMDSLASRLEVSKSLSP